MRRETRIVFDSIEESTKFKQIIMQSSSKEEAITNVSNFMKQDKTISTLAVNIFWNKRESYLKRYDIDKSALSTGS